MDILLVMVRSQVCWRHLVCLGLFERSEIVLIVLIMKFLWGLIFHVWYR